MVLACAAALLASSVALALVGPVSTPPGGVTITQTGACAPAYAIGECIGKGSGLNIAYSNFDFSQFETLHWGAAEIDAVAFAFDGGIDQIGETMTFDLAQSDLANGMARWTGQATLWYWVGSFYATSPFLTRFTLRVTDSLGNPVPMIQASALGIPGNGAVITVTGNFTANLLIETNSGGWQPALQVFDGYNTPYGMYAQSSFDGEFYYTDVPVAGLTAANDSPTPLGSPTTLTATITTGTNPSYAWDFGDGTLGSGGITTHTFPALGVYTALVTATNDANAITATTTITIVEAPIAGLAAMNDSPTLPGHLTTLTATITAGSHVTYTWDFGDGESGAGQIVTHTYLAAGYYTATVTASNSVSQLTATTPVSVLFGIVATGPAANAPAASRSALITATFNSNLNPSTVNTSTFHVWGSLTGPYTGALNFPLGDQMAFDSSVDFEPGETIAAVAGAGIQSSLGMTATRYQWQFRAAVGGGSGHFIDSGQRLSSLESMGVALGDLDGDGDLDAYVANEYTQPDEVWMNDGQGIFSKTQALGNFTSRDVALGDLDGDGDLDAFVAAIGANLVWLNNGGVQGGTLGVFSDSGQRMGNENSLAVALGDVDNDGDMDAVVANGTPSGQPSEVWLNDGAGNFGDSGQRLGVNGYSHGVALGDLDGDGDLDALITNWQRPNEVWWNDGSGVFANSGQNLGNANSIGVALGDLDGDSDLDAFITGVSATKVWLNDGGGHLADSGQSLGNAYSWRVELGDVDNDGDLDAFVANHMNAPNQLWLNNGIGTFSDSGQSMGNASSIGVALGDVDGDGDLDAYVANANNQPDEVWLNQVTVKSVEPAPNMHTASASANLTVTLSAPISQTTVTTQTFPVHGGFHGRLDGAFNFGDSIVFDPDSTFAPGELIEASVSRNILDSNNTPIFPYVWRFRTAVSGGSGHFVDSAQALGGLNSYRVALGDLDGDGDLDAFVANTNWPTGTTNTVWLNDGAGNYVDSGQALGTANSLGAALGDLDGDGDLDAFVANGYNEPNQVWLNDGSATFVDSGQSLGGSESYAVALGDLDGDGDLDAFIATYNAQPDEVWINDGTGIFSDSGQSLGSEYGLGTALGDVDGDGDMDAYVANCHGVTDKLWINNGAGHLSDSGQSLDGLCSYNAALGDLDGDGDLDVFITNGGSPSKVWLNDGVGHFADSGQNLGLDVNIDVALGDIDDDGDLDAFVTTGGQTNWVWLNDGTGYFSDSGQRLGSLLGRAVALGDVDSDGDLDAFIANDNNQPEQLWLNQDQAEVILVKSATPPNPMPGQLLTYTLAYTNLGPQASAGVLITDLVPITLTNVITAYSGALITPTGSISYAWQVQNLNAGQGGVITIVGVLSTGLPAGATFTNTAVITTTTLEGNAGNNSSLVRVTVANAPPAAADDNATAWEDSADNPLDVLVNDDDANGDAIIIVVVGLPDHGGSVISNATLITYTPAPDFYGAETFTYTVSDGNGGLGTAWVTFNVTNTNDAPDALDDSLAAFEDTDNALDVLTNDSYLPDPPETLTIVALGLPNQGGAITTTGTIISYTPVADFNGTETFTYTISDGSGGFDTAAVTATVANINDDPIANDDSFGVNEDSANHTLTVLDNDSYLPDPPEILTIATLGLPNHGGAAINGGSVITYTPAPDYNGTETFTYTASDGNGGFATATVTVIVTNLNDDPGAVDDTLTVWEDSADNPLDVLANDTYLPDPPETLVIIATGIPNHGGLVTATGTIITYTPAPDFIGTEIFTYTIADGNGGFDTAPVTITVNNINDAPLADNDAFMTNEDSANSALDVLAGDMDIDGDTLAISAVGAPSQGGSAINGSTIITYTPASNFFGAEIFTYTATDGHGGYATARVTVTVNAINDPPTADDDTFPVDEDSADNPLAVLDGDSDIEGDPLTIFAIGLPDQGGNAINSDSVVTYTPAPGFYGTETFTYTVTDGNGGFDTALVTITVNAINDPPTISDIADQNTTVNAPIGPITFTIGDPDTPIILLTLIAESSNTPLIPISAIVVGGSGAARSLTITPAANLAGTATITITVNDGAATVSDTFLVTVSGISPHYLYLPLIVRNYP